MNNPPIPKPIVLKHKGYITNIDDILYASLESLSERSIRKRLTDNEFSQLQVVEKIEIDEDPQINDFFTRSIEPWAYYLLNGMIPPPEYNDELVFERF